MDLPREQAVPRPRRRKLQLQDEESESGAQPENAADDLQDASAPSDLPSDMALATPSMFLLGPKTLQSVWDQDPPVPTKGLSRSQARGKKTVSGPSSKSRRSSENDSPHSQSPGMSAHSQPHTEAPRTPTIWAPTSTMVATA